MRSEDRRRRANATKVTRVRTSPKCFSPSYAIRGENEYMYYCELRISEDPRNVCM